MVGFLPKMDGTNQLRVVSNFTSQVLSNSCRLIFVSAPMSVVASVDVSACQLCSSLLKNIMQGDTPFAALVEMLVLRKHRLW